MVGHVAFEETPEMALSYLRLMHKVLPASAFAVLLVFLAPRVFAQQPAMGTLSVTVIDPSRAVIVGATVTVSAAEDVSKATIPPVKTGDTGIATIANLAPGRYTVQAEFPGFDTRVLRDVRVRP